jgi:chromosome segregation ATPase
MEQTENKTDIKNYAILFLGVVSIALILVISFSRGNDYSEEVEKLRSENALLEKKRNEIALRVDSLHKAYDVLQHRDDSLAAKILAQDAEISKLYADSRKSKGELERIRKEISASMKKIEELKKNPPNRTGNDLINSLKIKTEK